MKIVWTPESERTFNENIEYLAESWSVKTIHKFIDRVDQVIDNLADNPEKYPFHRKKDQVRRCVVNKHITLFFRVYPDRIDLLTFWNTHQDPDRLTL
jgi:plasmid stabilization system protein ParE